ncbi:MAG TPA: ABC transporter permease subunit [Thermoplasmata archaeon]|nr:ABC transporter permease subunit [Thermoplasmata archaeon]
MITLAFAYFRSTVTSVRFLIVSIVVGLIAALSSWRLVAFGFGGSPGSSSVWTLSADGALVALAAGFVPLLLPILPTAAAYYAAKRDAETAFLESALTQPVPRWSLGLGRFAGLALAIALVHVVATTVSVLVIYVGAAGTPLTIGLVTAFVAVAVLIGTVYLALAVWLAVFLRPRHLSLLSVPLWVGMNAIEPTALLMTVQALLIVPEQLLTFGTTWVDFLSVTGLYLGALAPAVPEQLAFVTGRDTVAYAGIPYGAGVWLVLLLFLHLLFLSLFPLGKR